MHAFCMSAHISMHLLALLANLTKPCKLQGRKQRKPSLSEFATSQLLNLYGLEEPPADDKAKIISIIGREVLVVVKRSRAV